MWREKLSKALTKLFSHKYLAKIITFLKEGDSYNSDTIESVDGTFAVEVGHDPRGSRVHAHALLKIAHYSKIRLNYAMIRRLLCKWLGLTTIHLHVRTAGAEAQLLDYISKDQ